jgi:hypothetical protein
MPDSKLHEDRRDKDDGGRPKKADSRRMMEEGEKRSGSDSDAHSGRKKSRLHEHVEREPEHHEKREPNFAGDLNPDDMAGADDSALNPPPTNMRSAYDLKEMHDTILADLTNDELKSVLILAAGTHLLQGAKYIDLAHLDQGEFTATSEMVAGPEHYYVSKKETDYVLWNRLNQVDNPARLDESEEEAEAES